MKRFSPSKSSRFPSPSGALVALATGGLAAGFLVNAAKRRHRISFAGRTVLITGGSRGLGLVLARQLAREGANLVLVARDEAELRLAKADLQRFAVRVLTCVGDVSVRADAEEAVRRAIEHFGRIDVLINNAGIIQVGPLAHMREKDFEQAMGVHFYGPLHFSRAVIPHMRMAGGGRIVNISSIGGKIAAPHMVPYTASKFALTGLSDGMRAELRSENIFVTTVCPGLMRTGSPPNAQFKGRHREEYAWFSIADSLPLLSMNAERAARKILDACRHGSPQANLGIQTKTAILLNDIFPGTTARLSSIVNRFLPEPADNGSNKTFTGWESESDKAPSLWTRPTYTAARRNNEG